jgi:pimeloyl-ACP methyl ester carboxylesterase
MQRDEQRSTRGRGLSGDHPESSPERLLGDVIAFVDSIGEPAPLAGWSGGGVWALGAAAHSDSVAAVAAYEPGFVEAMDGQTYTRVLDTFARMSERVERGHLREAARIFTELVATADEQEAVAASGRLDHAARNVSADLRAFAHLVQASGPSPTDPVQLARITVPVLVLLGERTARSWFADSARHVAEHVDECEIRTVPGAGHSAPGLMPATVAAEIVRLLEPARQPA